MVIRCADHVTPLYPQKLALTSPTSGGRSVGIVRSRTKAKEFLFTCIWKCLWRRLLFNFMVAFEFSGILVMIEEHKRARSTAGSFFKLSEFDSRNVQFECQPDL